MIKRHFKIDTTEIPEISHLQIKMLRRAGIEAIEKYMKDRDIEFKPLTTIEMLRRITYSGNLYLAEKANDLTKLWPLLPSDRRDVYLLSKGFMTSVVDGNYWEALNQSPDEVYAYLLTKKK